MDDNFEKQRRAQQTIRANMEWKETGELIDIWLKQDTDEWTAEALQVVGEILRERGVDLNDLKDEKPMTNPASDPGFTSEQHDPGSLDEEIAHSIHQKMELRMLSEKYVDELEEKSTQELVWLFRTQLVYLQAIRQALADRGIDTEGYEESDLDLPAETLKCSNCDADMPGNARYCPQCGIALYPEGSEEDEENSNL